MLKEAVQKSRNHRTINKITKPVMRQMPSLYKTRKAKGWGVVTDALLSDDASTPGK
jgi:hypothetical protein